MKYSLWCTLLGHLFQTWDEEKFNLGYSGLVATRECVRCGKPNPAIIGENKDA